MKLASLTAGQFVETGGYYAKGDAGAARYLIVAAQAADGYGDHTLANGTVAVLQSGAELAASQFGVKSDGTASADALEAVLSYANNLTDAKVVLPTGNILIERSLIGLNGTILVGQGIEATVLQSNGDYTVFEFTGRFEARDLTLQQISGTFEGIGFGNKRTDTSDNQATYTRFERVSVTGFDFSWWYRASIWCSWKDNYSKSLVGIRFARNADPYDVTSDAPGAWNQFLPTLGWFHNVGTIENVNFEDDECGVYGCAMGYTLLSNTTQSQNGDKANHKILPVTEDPTGIWLQSGATGTRNGWANSITSSYSEVCFRTFKIQDQRSCTISTGFIQGGSVGTPYPTPIEVDNSLCYIDGFTGQLYFDTRVIAKNDATVYGKIEGLSTGGTVTIEDTSKLFEKREYGTYITGYQFTSGTAVDSYEIPVDLSNNSHYVLKVGGLYNGSSIRNATFDVFRKAGDSLTSIELSSGTTPNFNVTVSGGRLVVNKTGSFIFDFNVTLHQVSESVSQSEVLTPI